MCVFDENSSQAELRPDTPGRKTVHCPLSTDNCSYGICPIGSSITGVRLPSFTA